MTTQAKKSTTTKKTTTKGTRTKGPQAKAAREKLALLDSLQGMGLLSDPDVERLQKKAEAIAEAGDEALAQAAAFDRGLGQGLAGFEAGAASGAAAALQALLLWQGSAAENPPTGEGLAAALASLRKVVPYDGATLYLRDSERGTVRPLAMVGAEVELIGRIRFTEGTGFSSWVAARKRPVLYPSLHRNEAPGEANIRSFMSVPMVAGGECVGVVHLGHHEEGFYDQAALRTLALAASTLAALVQRHVALAQIAAREIADSATGLATPGYIRSRLEEEVVRCRELGHSMCLATLRLEGLPEHVERFGPEYRERCRAELAGIVRSWRQPAELVGHGEGDSLLVILPAVRRERAEARIAELRSRVEKHNFPRRKKMALASGIATYPADADEAQELFDCADKSLYEGGPDRGVRPGPIPTVATS